MYRTIVCFVLVIFPSLASACINDSELVNHEREFRSQYRAEPTRAAPTTNPSSPSTGTLFAVGGILLLGATILAVGNLRLSLKQLDRS
jgi:hypothetical protein